MRDCRLYLKDIVGAMNDIEDFLEGMNREAFESDKKTFSAVVRQLEIIGEAAKQVPDEIRITTTHVYPPLDSVGVSCVGPRTPMITQRTLC